MLLTSNRLKKKKSPNSFRRMDSDTLSLTHSNAERKTKTSNTSVSLVKVYISAKYILDHELEKSNTDNRKELKDRKVKQSHSHLNTNDHKEKGRKRPTQRTCRFPTRDWLPAGHCTENKNKNR